MIIYHPVVFICKRKE